MTKFRFILEYSLIVIIKLILRIIPEKSIPALTKYLANFINRFLPYRKKVILTNLSIAFPDLPTEEKEAMLPKIYQHLLLFIFEIILLFRWPNQKVLQVVHIENILPFKEYLENGGILLSGHLGNWEIFARALCINHFPLSVIMKAQKNPYVNRAIVKWRNEVGMGVIFTKGALKESLAELKKKKIITLLGDQELVYGMSSENIMQKEYFSIQKS